MLNPFILNQKLREQLRNNLDQFDFKIEEETTLRRAAVALVVTSHPDDQDKACVLLTRRPARLNQHSGQYALPGGKLDGDETVFEAARRELQEELGISLTPEQILGRLDDYSTRSGFCISPVVLWAGRNIQLSPSPDEVAAVFHIPLHEMNGDAMPILERGADPGRPVLCSEFPTLGHKMYSPTAAVMFQFREVAMRGASTRVSHFDQPEFAWR